MIKNRFKIVLDGAFIPFIVFVGITLLTTFIYCIIYGIENINAMLVQGIADIFVICALIPIYMNFNKKYGITKSSVTLKKVLYIIPLSISICIIANILIQFLPTTKNNVVTKEIIELTEKYNLGISILLVALFVPIVEELIFRGFFYNVIYILKSHKTAIIITSIIFGIAHFNLEQGIYGLIAGLFLAYIRYKFNNLIYTIIMHLIMNFCSLTVIAQILLKSNIYRQMNILTLCVIILVLIIYRINKLDWEV